MEKLTINAASFMSKSLDVLQNEFDTMQNNAMNYLRSKFPGVDDSVFLTRYSGRQEEVLPPSIISTILICDQCDKLCAKCKDFRQCEVKTFLASTMRPDIELRENSHGLKYLEVRNTNSLRCKFGAWDPELKNRLMKCGLARLQLSQSFETYQPQNDNQQRAKNFMMNLRHTRMNAILAGKRGTGKTHLAIAACIDLIRTTKSKAKFEVVAEMLDKIRRAIFNKEDYFSLIDSYKQVDLLVLDDLGKEKQSDAACDYLFQIIDSRYRNALPTVITTNASSPEELAKWGRPEVYEPIISRIMQTGSWIPFFDGSDYRMRFITREEVEVDDGKSKKQQRKRKA